MSEICKNRTVIITGAGGGLGRAHALAFAGEGANVVVNDINGEAADAVVADIKALGGSAVSDTFDITDYAACGKAVENAIAAFGDLHIVVNNAGINRDRMFASMTEQEWDAIMAVHLKGHFCLSSNAVQYWRAQVKQGKKVSARIINTSSGAGLQGSIGQSNYVAAKAGIAALTLNQAAELGRYGITANAITPAARTAMTTQVDVMAERMKKPDDGSFDYWAAGNVSPLLVWLGSELSANVSGKVFEAEGGKISIADGWRTTQGVDKGDQWLPSEVGGAVAELIAKEVPAQAVYGTQ
jgi:NAD(P)-dependent dehydrogenase (short-subunit alcohol dehydrogenase family)